MEEDQYRSTYHQFNQNRCTFEKSILARRCNCPHAHKFCLAEREGIACQQPQRQTRCQQFLNTIREKSLFTLKLTSSDSPLPHAKEIRVQVGSLEGLVTLLDQKQRIPTDDIVGLLAAGEQKFKGLANIPLEPLIRQISQTQGRQKRARKK